MTIVDQINLRLQTKRITRIDIVVAAIILANFLFYATLLICLRQSFITFLCELDKGYFYQMHYMAVRDGALFYSGLPGWDVRSHHIQLFFLPFMYIYPNIPVTYSLISTALLSLGALPVYWLATNVGKSEKIGLLFVGLYFLYPSLGWLFLESVHSEIFVLPFLLFAFYYMYINSYLKSMSFLLLAIICKQNMLLVLPMFAVYAYLKNYDKRWIGGPIAISAGWFLSLYYLIYPYFYGSSIRYGSVYLTTSVDKLSSNGLDLASHLPTFSGPIAERYGWMGSTFPDILLNLITNPFSFIQHIVAPENVVYLLILLIPLCGISLLKPKILLIGTPIFLVNILSDFDAGKMISWHYVSVLVFVIIVSAILAFPLLYEQLNGRYKKIFVSIIIIVSFASFFACGPITEIKGEIDKLNNDNLSISQENINKMHNVLNEIPPDSTILTTRKFYQYLYRYENVRVFEVLYNHQSPFHENYDYYILRTDSFGTRSDLDVLQQILQRSDIHAKYYDGKYIILGTEGSEQDVNIKKIDKLSLIGFRFQPNVGQIYYDTEIDEAVFFSSKIANSSGYLAYGPYMNLPAGNYSIEFIMKAKGVISPDDVVATIDIFSTYIEGPDKTHVVDARKDVCGRDLDGENYTPISLELSVDTLISNRLIEFRVFQPLNSDLYIKEINIIEK